jgi:hypothetical protein
MEQIFSAMSDAVGWIEEEYGVVAAWAAVIVVIVTTLVAICIAIVYGLG